VRDALVGLGLALLALMAIGLGSFLALAIPGDMGARNIVLLAASLAFEGALFLVALALTLGRYPCRWSHLGFRPPRAGGWWVPLAVVGAAFLILITYDLLLRLLGLEAGRPRPTLPEELFHQPLTVALAGVLAVVFAPLAEETFFRGFLFAALRHRWGFLRAALLSGFLFALPHADPGSLIPITGVGIVLAGAYAYSGSLWSAISSHALFNFISFTAAAIAGLGGGP